MFILCLHSCLNYLFDGTSFFVQRKKKKKPGPGGKEADKKSAAPNAANNQGKPAAKEPTKEPAKAPSIMHQAPNNDRPHTRNQDGGNFEDSTEKFDRLFLILNLNDLNLFFL